MKVLIIDIDSKIPNLALKKIEKYHLNKGDEIIWNNELMAYSVDKIYISCIFSWNKDKCKFWEQFDNVMIGGSGYSLDIKLPEQIEKIKPKINWGFTTRGCIRKCEFCIVPKKEGNIHVVGDIYDIWDGKNKEIIILDNNILAHKKHFKLICSQLRKENLKVDFNQGLDHRLLNDELCKELLSLKHIHEIRFAYDDILYKSTVLKALNILQRNGIKDWQTRWYIYIGKKDNYNTVYDRMKLLKNHKQHVYIMRDREIYNKKEFVALAQLGNTAGAFKMDWKKVINLSEKLRHYKKYLRIY